MNRAERMRLNPYQREGSVGRGKDHWAMATGREKCGLADYVTILFKRGGKSPALSQFYTPEALGKALLPPIGKNKVVAFVNHNRWIAKCECGGAEVVDPSNRVFYCFSCFNENSKGRSRKVKFPRNFDVIEKILEVRDDPYTRNWLVGETAEDLGQENEDHGLSKDNK